MSQFNLVDPDLGVGQRSFFGTPERFLPGADQDNAAGFRALRRPDYRASRRVVNAVGSQPASAVTVTRPRASDRSKQCRGHRPLCPTAVFLAVRKHRAHRFSPPYPPYLVRWHSTGRNATRSDRRIRSPTRRAPLRILIQRGASATNIDFVSIGAMPVRAVPYVATGIGVRRAL